MPPFPQLNRRHLLKTGVATAASLAATPWSRASSSGEPPRVLYSNDTTNIMSCVSPWRDRKDGLTDDHLRNTIREAAGAQVHILQPGLGWIPWWDSEHYSPREHYEVFMGEHGLKKPNAVGRYLLAGGDLVRTLTNECEKLGILPFVSIRLNDGHHTRKLAAALEASRPDQSMSRFYWENVDRYRIGNDVLDWGQSVFDWAIPEVPEDRALMIEELCRTHSFAGLELDFMRHWSRFSEKTSPEEREHITTHFVRRIRQALDQKTYRGERRWLGVRVPAALELHPHQGVHLQALVEDAGVDFINLSYSYFTMQTDAVERLRQILPEVPIYVEMTHTTLTGRALAGSGTQPYLRTTEEQFYTTAHLAYEQGATGVSLFNFAYYREHSLPDLGPFHEPPFHVIEKLRDLAFLARQPQWYFLSAGRNDPLLSPTKQLPVLLKTRGEAHTFRLRLAPTDHQQGSGILRFRSSEPIDDRELEVRFNGTLLKPSETNLMPIDHPYDVWLGEPEELRCFQVPRELIRPDMAEISFQFNSGIRVKLDYLDLVIPA